MKVSVIGSGVMGAGIAELIANYGFKVKLLDVPQEENRNILAQKAKAKMSLYFPDNLEIGNIEDNLNELVDYDWVIEVIIEKIEIKRNLYASLEKICNENSIISSNTSTIPHIQLIEGRSNNFKNRFFITHFFNPPQIMPLVELVTTEFTNKKLESKIVNFLDYNLGKTVIKTKDTPGFIANRLGCYWLLTSINIAIQNKLPIEEIDSLLSYFGIPKTGAFGLCDLIGIDVMCLISNSLSKSLDKQDEFNSTYLAQELLLNLIENKLIGRKSNKGFYKIAKNIDGEKIVECLDLSSLTYRPEKKLKKSYSNIISLMDDKKYIWEIVSNTLLYAVRLLREASDEIYSIDQAMKLGYNWKYGPFELLDKIGIEYFCSRLKKDKKEIPKLLDKLKTENFYKEGKCFNGKNYEPIKKPEGIIFLSDLSKNKVICQNESARFIELKDKIALLEFTGKLNMADHAVFDIILEFYQHYEAQFSHLIIFNEASFFSVGGNLKFMRDNKDKPNLIEDYLQLGQKAMLAIKYSPITAIAGLKGKALGGGCEFLLHCDYIISSMDNMSGLVESGVGLIPGWGGCKELILRSSSKEQLKQAFINIISGKISNSAYDLKHMIYENNFEICPNPNRVLQKSIEATKLVTKKKQKLANSLALDCKEIISTFNNYQKVIAKELSSLFEGNFNEKELLEMERNVFLSLLKNKETQERINFMLETGKRLEN